MLASNAPATVPHRAIDTVMPSRLGESSKVEVRADVAPAMTAVSKPNSNPPRAATTVLFTSVVFSAMHFLPREALRCERLDSDKYVPPRPKLPALLSDCRVPEERRRCRFAQAKQAR